MIPFLKPDLRYKTDILSVRLEDIKNLGVEALILDLDNTIIAPKTAKLDMPIKYWLDLMKKHFKIIVLTNNKRPFYLETCEQILDLPVIGFAHKPWNPQKKKIQELLDFPNEKICVIGDRPLTDIWFSKRNNMKSILVKPLIAEFEPWWKKILRRLEAGFVIYEK